MDQRMVLAGLVLVLARAISAQGVPAGTVGWYNGDCSSPIDGWNDYYLSDTQFMRIWDDFVVPPGGWTITGVFSNNSLYVDPSQVTQVSWVIASGLGAGSTGGTVVASGLGLSAVTPTRNANGTYHLEVDDLWVQLPPGTYWLSMAPVAANLKAFVCETAGGERWEWRRGRAMQGLSIRPTLHSGWRTHRVQTCSPGITPSAC